MRLTGSEQAARTGALFTLVASQLLHVFECKSEEKTLFNVPLFDNIFMLAAVALSLIVILAAVYLPFLQGVFSTVALSPLCIAIAAAYSFAVPLLSAVVSSKTKI